MADTEFEEFRKHFDKLPQYIKATPQCYTLVPNIDLTDDEGTFPDSLGLPNSQLNSGAEYFSEGGDEGHKSIQEPFAGDLEIIITDRIEKYSPIVKRKRRKLPELPKNHSLKWNGEGRQISLAEELSEAATLSRNAQLDNETSPHSDFSFGQSYQQHSIEHTMGNSSNEESSPDSEKYPSFDSGRSTINSDDGTKPHSPQIHSINESFSSTSPYPPAGVPFPHLELLDATHRGLHKFNPRHHDEIEIDIGDPIYMQKEADDLWCDGVNLRTGMQGIFPSAYVVDVEYNDFDPGANKVKKERYLTNYIGSIETLYHKGNEVLCQAVKKITGQKNYVAAHTRSCILEISDQGIRMLDKGKQCANRAPCHDYFYALKNVSFCGFHPYDHRYFGFVTKHPTLNRFACHVFISDESTRPVAEAVGRAFQRFYQKFLDTAYPIEDIYLE